MKLASWNINSLNVRLPHVIDWLAANPVDVLCLQELKLPDEKFPEAQLKAIGYRSFYAGQKTYNGVAILTREDIPFDAASIQRNIPGFEDPQQRLIAVTLNDTRVICAYFPNGQAPGTDKFAYKLKWMDALSTWLESELSQHERLALLGDYNIAPAERDVHDPLAWEGQNLVSPEERAAFTRLCSLGLTDAFRCFEQAEKIYSWWDYRMLSFRRNAGLRIDHILLSSTLTAACERCIIDKIPRGWLQPSDHAPVIADIIG